MNFLITELYWREPLWMFLAIFPLLLILWQKIKQRHSLRRYADAALHPWILMSHHGSVGRHKKMYQAGYQFMIWVLLGIAAAGPRLLASAPEELLPPKGAAVIIVDQSGSMLADDVQPNRLQLANNTVIQWMNPSLSSERLPSKLGLIVFAGASHIVLPATLDTRALQQAAELLDKIQLPTRGSAMLEAIQQARYLLADETGSRAIILLSDGDLPNADFQPINKLSKVLNEEKINLHLLGVGTPSPIALTDGKGGWLLQDGLAVTSGLNEAAFRKLAETPGTDYHRLNLDIHHSLDKIWKPVTQRIADKNQDQVVWKELFPCCLVLAILLIFFNQFKWPRSVVPTVSISLTLFFVVHPSAIQAAEKNTLKSAYAAWTEENYSLAAKLYSEVNGYAGRMGEGASCFRNAQVECAIHAFSRAAWLAENDQQRGRASFNLANSFFKQGDFKSSITLYQDAIKYQSEQLSYQHNLEFTEEVQRRIELRLQQEAASQKNPRRGSGGIAVNVEDGTLVTPNMRMTLDKEPKEFQLSEKNKINLSEQQLAQYMQLSQMFASLNSGEGKSVQAQHDWSRFSNENPSAARKVAFWQRLFELEEGIPVHPDVPKVLPGIRPW